LATYAAFIQHLLCISTAMVRIGKTSRMDSDSGIKQ
jgi:hypothetical protein